MMTDVLVVAGAILDGAEGQVRGRDWMLGDVLIWFAVCDFCSRRTWSKLN